MSFLGNIINEFTHQKGSGGSQQQSYGGNNNNYGGPPQVPPPWVAEWDQNAQRWFYVNRQTGQRSWEHPGQSQGGYYGGSSNEYRGQGYTEPKKDHSGRNMALGAAAGLAGGALLMHEGEKIHEDWDEDKYRMEQRADRFGQDVEDFPEDAARWTGRKVQDVEDIPERVERKWDDGVQDVEDIPEDVAGWAGRRVGDVDRFGDDVRDKYDDARDDVDRFGDNMDNAYDQGRDDTRYRDDDY